MPSPLHILINIIAENELLRNLRNPGADFQLLYGNYILWASGACSTALLGPLSFIVIFPYPYRTDLIG